MKYHIDINMMITEFQHRMLPGRISKIDRYIDGYANLYSASTQVILITSIARRRAKIVLTYITA